MNALVLRTLATLLFSAVAGSAQPPNVLLIMADDQGYGDLSLHGNPHLQTPHLDRLAREGAQFSHFFVSPVCAPTRAALLTGRYPARTGTWGVARGQETMRAEEITLAEVLRDAGWHTALFGKWHLGEHFPHDARGQGFQTFFGFARGHWNNYFDTTVERDGRAEPTRGYLPDVLTDEAIRFIEAQREAPFFCKVAYQTPHSPFQVPDAYFDRYQALGLSDELACIYGMCANLDDNVGRLLAKLDAHKLSERTIVVFLSDNGPNTPRFNAGLKGRKGSVEEGGVRVPCFVRWPGRIAPKVVPQIAAHIDLLPTLLELCDVSLPPAEVAAGNSGGRRVGESELDGLSLAPLLLGGSAPWPERMLFVHQVRGDTPKPFPGAARTQRHRAVNAGQGWQLFDFETDPSQQRDLAATAPDIVRELGTAYDAWWRGVAPARFERLPVPVGHEGHDRVEISAAECVRMPGLRFSGKHPNNAWLIGWTDLSAHAEWEIEVARAGIYRVSLQYVAETAGARVRLSNRDAHAEATAVATPLEQVPSPDRVPRDEVYEWRWSALPLGELPLPAGRQTLRLEALEKPGAEALRLKAVLLERKAATPNP